MEGALNSGFRIRCSRCGLTGKSLGNIPLIPKYVLRETAGARYPRRTAEASIRRIMKDKCNFFIINAFFYSHRTCVFHNGTKNAYPTKIIGLTADSKYARQCPSCTSWRKLLPQQDGRGKCFSLGGMRITDFFGILYFPFSGDHGDQRRGNKEALL